MAFFYFVLFQISSIIIFYIAKGEKTGIICGFIVMLIAQSWLIGDYIIRALN